MKKMMQQQVGFQQTQRDRESCGWKNRGGRGLGLV